MRPQTALRRGLSWGGPGWGQGPGHCIPILAICHGLLPERELWGRQAAAAEGKYSGKTQLSQLAAASDEGIKPEEWVPEECHCIHAKAVYEVIPSYDRLHLLPSHAGLLTSSWNCQACAPLKTFVLLFPLSGTLLWWSIVWVSQAGTALVLAPWYILGNSLVPDKSGRLRPLPDTHTFHSSFLTVLV